MAKRLIIALLTLPAWGGSLAYTTLAAWQASSPGSTAVLDFTSVTPAYYTSFAWSPYAFSAASGALYVLPGASAGTGSGNYLTTVDALTLNVTFAAGVYGISFNLGSNAASAASASILATDINGVQYLTSAVTTSGPAGPAIFWGLRATDQLASAKIVFTTAQPQIDNVRYADTALPPQGPVIPEPSAWILVATGGVLFLLRRPTSRFAGSSTPAARTTTATGWHRENR